MMTVKELIEALQHFDQDKPVVIWSCYGDEPLLLSEASINEDNMAVDGEGYIDCVTIID